MPTADFLAGISFIVVLGVVYPLRLLPKGWETLQKSWTQGEWEEGGVLRTSWLKSKNYSPGDIPLDTFETEPEADRSQSRTGDMELIA